MNSPQEINIRSLEEFVAHAIALKYETEERIDQLAHCLDEHNNPVAAEVFHNITRSVKQVILELEEEAGKLTLPNIPPWEYQWRCADDPEALCIDQAHYLMGARESLMLALFNELRSLHFFQVVNETVNDPSITQLTKKLISMELGITNDIQRQLDEMPEADESGEDWDPPNMPE